MARKMIFWRSFMPAILPKARVRRRNSASRQAHVIAAGQVAGSGGMRMQPHRSNIHVVCLPDEGFIRDSPIRPGWILDYHS
jgi:hypothetical protein